MLRALVISIAMLPVPAFAQGADAAHREVAGCVADNDARGVKALLATLPGSAAERRAGERLTPLYGACDNNGSAHGAFAWRDRAELADMAVQHELEGSVPDVVAAVAQPAWQVQVAASLKAGADYDAAGIGMRRFGECVVRTAPAASLRLLRAPRGSSAEASAIAEVTPALGPCLPAGQHFQLKRQDLRLLLAEPLYHAMWG